MTAYLYPERKTKKAYIELIKAGATVVAEENTPNGRRYVEDGVVTFEGPHYPKPHTYYGTAWIRFGKVVWIE